MCFRVRPRGYVGGKEKRAGAKVMLIIGGRIFEGIVAVWLASPLEIGGASCRERA